MTSRTSSLKFMIMDACVLIDFIKSDRSVLELIVKYVGPLHVVSLLVDEIKEIDGEEELAALGLIIVEPEIEDAYTAGICQPTCRFSWVKVSRALPSFSGLSHTTSASSRFLAERPFHRSGCFRFASSNTTFLAARIAADSPR